MSDVKDFDWISLHYAELQRKYLNMYVAVKDGKVLVAHRDFDRVYDEALKKVGKGFVTGYVMSMWRCLFG